MIWVVESWSQKGEWVVVEAFADDMAALRNANSRRATIGGRWRVTAYVLFDVIGEA